MWRWWFSGSLLLVLGAVWLCLRSADAGRTAGNLLALVIVFVALGAPWVGLAVGRPRGRRYVAWR